MTTGTRRLSEFLLARIAEDEARHQRGLDIARSLGPGKCISFASRLDDEPSGTYMPARALAQCAGQRWLVEISQTWEPEVRYAWLRVSAAVYSDHPDYDARWSA